MGGWAGSGCATFLAASWVLLVSCGIGASPDTELLMQAPFASDLNWVAATNLCNSHSPAANVTCDVNDNVTELVILAPPSGAANVMLLPQWGNLTHLVKLDVTGAVGTLPPEWGTIGSFPNLEAMGLSDNNLTGSLPAEWGSHASFPSLQRLFLHHSNLSGSLPAGWGCNGSFPLLQELYLGENTLSGSLPAEWATNGSFPKLWGLYLNDNKLSGSLPVGWGINGSFPLMQKLSLKNNSISIIGSRVSSHDMELLMEAPFAYDFNWTGSAGLCSDLPYEELYPTYHIGCDDHFNVISMKIWPPYGANITLPPGWGNLAHLTTLKLSGAAGSLPPEWGSAGSFPMLQELDLSSGSLTGSLPPEWGSAGSFSKLETVRLDHNNRTDSLPGEWGNRSSFSQLKMLNLDQNSLSGSLPAEWGRAGSFPKLERLRLAADNLSGILPTEWGSAGSFPQLLSLDLSYNNLSGSLPAGWCSNGSFPQLQWLAMFVNSLNGSLPAGWGSNGSFPMLEYLGLSVNSLSGSLPAGWGSDGSFPQLKVLSLSNNNLGGTLPVKWGVPVDLSISALQGVPATIKALPFSSLNHLFLWKNNFEEGVPLDWTNNPQFLSARLVLDASLFMASKESHEFAKGICTDPYRYLKYRNWSIAVLRSEECDMYTKYDTFVDMPDDCFTPAFKTDLDPCSLDRKTRDAIIVLWSCFGLIVLLVCLEDRVVALMDQHVPGFLVSRKHTEKRIDKFLSGRRRILFGMLATVIIFWADIASDVPVFLETLAEKGHYFYILLSLLLGSHMLDAILVAVYDVAKGNKVSYGLIRVPENVVWFMLYFLLAAIALPALDVLCFVGPRRDKPVDAIFELDLEGYQTMRLVIGAVFRTIPTAIVLTVIAALGNNPSNGTYFDSTVVSASLSLCALQIIVVIIQIRKRAAAQKKTKLQLLWAVFTLKGLARLPDGGVSAAREGPRHREFDLHPFCTTTPQCPSERTPLVRSRPVVRVRLEVQEEE